MGQVKKSMILQKKVFFSVSYMAVVLPETHSVGKTVAAPINQSIFSYE